MSLTPNDQRHTFNTLIEDNRLDDALKSLADYVAAHRTAEAHILRLEILVQQFNPDSGNHAISQHIAESLDALGTPPPPGALPHTQALQNKMEAYLKQQANELDEAPAKVRQNLDSLIPLADYFLSFHFLLGQAIVAVMNRPRRESLFSRNDAPGAPSAKELELGHASLLKVVNAVQVDDPMYREALVLLIEICKRQNNFRAALEWCEKADNTMPDMLETWDKVGGDSLQHLLTFLDNELRADKPTDTFKKLAKMKKLQLLPEVRARFADAALLNGELGVAASNYDIVRQNIRDYREDAAQKRAILKDLGRVYKQFSDQIKPPKFPTLTRFLSQKKSATDARVPIDRYGFPRADMRLYGISGLIAVAEASADPQAMINWIYTLLNDRQIPAASNSSLVDQLHKLEKEAAYQHYIKIQGQAEASRDAQDWEAARAHYLTLTSADFATDDDFMWLAVCLAHLEEAPVALCQLLEARPASAITCLPKPTARALLDYLSDGQQWAMADRFWPFLKSAKKWAENYQSRREAFRHSQLEAAAVAVVSGRLNRANHIAHTLLGMDAQDAAALLIVARVRIAQRHWSAARAILTPLVRQCPPYALALRPEAERLLTEVDLAEGHYARAEALLRAGEDTVAAEGVRRRMEQTPFICVEQANTTIAPDTLTRRPAEVYNAYFAVRLAGVHIAAHIPSMQHQMAEFLIGLHRVDEFMAQPHFTWRYIGRDGRLTVCLICRVEANSATVAEATALNIWHVVRHLLPFQTQQIYTYEPIIHPDELAYVRQPLPIVSAAQVVRAESNGNTLDGLYRVQPFATYTGNMHRLLRMIADHPGGAIMETYFHPTDVFAWERAAIEKMISQNHRSNGTREYTPPSNLVVQLEQSATNQAAAQVYQDFFGTIQSLPFIVQTRVGASTYLDPALPDLIGLELFGPSVFRVQTAHTQDEVEAAARTMQEISAERWGYTAAPDGLARWRYLLTPMETLTAIRLPVLGVDGLPGVPTSPVRVAQLPQRLPETGTVIGESIVPIRGKPAEIRQTNSDKLRHTYVVGRTGTGKSTLLQNLALQDIEAGHGVAVIDPHGDLVENLLSRIPAHRRHDVILFDPGDVSRPIGLNILDVQGTYAQNIVISDFIGLLYVLFDPNRIGMIGPRFENVVRNSMLLAMDIKGSTFIEVIRIMTDKNFREECLKLATDPIVKSYWTDVSPNLARMGDGDMLDYVTSKFGRFVNDRVMRNIIGQSENALDLKGIMNDGKILLVNLAKGRMGPEASHFLGLILMPQIFIAALSRANMPEAQRRLFCLYVDEFHNFTTPTFSTMLAEARKYGVALTVANQFISQLTPSIREAVFGNVGTLLSFRVGINDARFLAQEFYPVYGENDLINLPNYYTLAKMLVDGDAMPPFPVRTLPDNRAEERAIAEQIRHTSQMRYGRDDRVVNLQIRQRYENPPNRRG